MISGCFDFHGAGNKRAPDNVSIVASARRYVLHDRAILSTLGSSMHTGFSNTTDDILRQHAVRVFETKRLVRRVAASRRNNIFRRTRAAAYMLIRAIVVRTRRLRRRTNRQVVGLITPGTCLPRPKEAARVPYTLSLNAVN